MAKLITVFNPLGGEVVPPLPLPLKVKAGAVGSIIPGMPVIADGGNAGYVKAAPDGTINTALVVGVANSTSTDTVATDGTVTVDAAPVLLCKMFAKTPANLTAAMVLTNKYTLSVSGGAYTMDQGTTTNGFIRLLDFDNVTNGLCTVSIQCNAY